MVRLATLLSSLLLLSALAPEARALSDSREPFEPAPVEELGPPAAPGAQVAPVGARVEIAASRRSARVSAAFSITAPPGELTVEVPSTLFQVHFESGAGGPPLLLSVERADTPQGPAE